MAISTYSDLLDRMANWLHRSDLNNRLQDAIQLFEAEMNRGKLYREMEAETTLAYGAGVDNAPVPADYRAIKYLDPRISGWPTARLVSDDVFYGRYNNYTAQYPTVFIVRGSSIIVRPAPQVATTLYLGYWQKIPALSSTTTTNWLLTKAPDAYLYGSLMQIAPFIGDDPRIDTWNNYYQRALDSLDQASDDESFMGPLVIRSDYTV